MSFPQGLVSLFWIVFVAALAPLVVSRLVPRIPQVVVLLVSGIIIGPQVLGLAERDESINLLAGVGLGFLFFTAGYELDLASLRGRTTRLAVASWVTSMGLSLLVVGLLEQQGIVKAYLPVAIALTSTALGALLPILRDSGQVGTPLSRAVVANGAVGEFGPILAISLLLGSTGAVTSLLLLIAFSLAAFVISRLPRRLFTERVRQDFIRGEHTTAQTAVRWTVVLLIGLLLLAAEFGLDTILGAFVAGVILRQTTPHGSSDLEAKIEGLAFGLFVPVFFVVSGMTVDVQSIIQNPLRLLLFFALIAVLRGGPALLLFRNELPGTQPLQLALYTATGLPIIVAVTEIGLATGVMLPENAAALVGAGLLTMLLFPLAASQLGLRERPVDGEPTSTATPDAEPTP